MIRYEPREFRVYGKVILGLAPFSMEPKISKVAVTYECSSPEEALARASVRGFVSIDKVVEICEVETGVRL